MGCYLLRICKAEEQRSLFNAILRLWVQGIAKQSSSQSTFPLKINKQHRVHISFQPTGRSRASGQEKRLPKVFLARDFCSPHSHFAPAVLEENPAAMQAEEIVKALRSARGCRMAFCKIHEEDAVILVIENKRLNKAKKGLLKVQPLLCRS